MKKNSQGWDPRTHRKRLMYPVCEWIFARDCARLTSTVTDAVAWNARSRPEGDDLGIQLLGLPAALLNETLDVMDGLTISSFNKLLLRGAGSELQDLVRHVQDHWTQHAASSRGQLSLTWGVLQAPRSIWQVKTHTFSMCRLDIWPQRDACCIPWTPGLRTRWDQRLIFNLALYTGYLPKQCVLWPKVFGNSWVCQRTICGCLNWSVKAVTSVKNQCQCASCLTSSVTVSLQGAGSIVRGIFCLWARSSLSTYNQGLCVFSTPQMSRTCPSGWRWMSLLTWQLV